MGTFSLAGSKYNIDKYGSALGAGELTALAEKSKLDPSVIAERFKQAGGTLSDATKARLNAAAANTAPPPGNDDDYREGGDPNWREKFEANEESQRTLFQNIYDFQKNLEEVRNQGTLNSTTVRSDADKEIAKIEAASRNYGYDRGLEGTKYTADKEALWREAVANIEVKGKLDLQPIINAGLTRVAEIEGQSAKDVADITGSYGLKSMQERTAADKSLGKMQLAGGMYGLIGAAFG